MPVKLRRKEWVKRVIPLGSDVSVTFKRFGLAEYKAAEHMAHKRARRELATVEASALSLTGDEGMTEDDEAMLIGKASEYLLDALVLGFADSWSGVIDDDASTDEDEVEAPLTAATWAQFKSECPILVDHLHNRITIIHTMVDAEGKDCAPLRDTGTQGA